MSPMRQVRVRRWMVGAVLVAMFALPFAAFLVGGQVNENCTGIHRIVEVGHEIIAQGRVNTEEYYREGLLTRPQRDRALRDITRQLRVWDSADCTS